MATMTAELTAELTAEKNMIEEFAKYDNHSYYVYPKVFKMIECAEAAINAGYWSPVILAAVLCLDTEPDMDVRTVVQVYCNELIISPTWERGRHFLTAYVVARCVKLPNVKAMMSRVEQILPDSSPFNSQTLITNINDMFLDKKKSRDRVQHLKNAIRDYFSF